MSDVLATYRQSPDYLELRRDNHVCYGQMFPDNYLESISYHLKLSNYFAVINMLNILAVTG